MFERVEILFQFDGGGGEDWSGEARFDEEAADSRAHEVKEC